MRKPLLFCWAIAFASFGAYADGPSDRKPTDPQAVTSESGHTSTPLPVEAVLTTTSTGGVSLSNDGRKLVCISDKSGVRPKSEY